MDVKKKMNQEKINKLIHALQSADRIFDLLREGNNLQIHDYVESNHNSRVQVSKAHDEIKLALRGAA